MSFTLWFTGISGSGKTTLSRLTVQRLQAYGLAVELLDGDTVRSLMDKELGFGDRDRRINMRFLGVAAYLLNRNNVAAVVAAISPYEEARQLNRELIPNYSEIFCDCSLEAAARRDVKGLYARALRGEIPNFTGVTSVYQRPVTPEVSVYTDRESVDESLERIMAHVCHCHLREGAVAGTSPELALAMGLVR